MLSIVSQREKKILDILTYLWPRWQENKRYQLWANYWFFLQGIGAKIREKVDRLVEKQGWKHFGAVNV